MKRVLGIISVVGVLGVTGWLIFSLLTNSGIIFPEGKPVPANIPEQGYWKMDLGYWKWDLNYWKMEFSNSGFAKFFSSNVEDSIHTKLEFPKVESGDSEPPNQPPAPAPPPPPSPTPTTEPESSFSPLCDPFDGMELSLMILSIREDIMVLPLYLNTHGEVIPGLIPLSDDGKSAEYHAVLGYGKSNSCGLQGFEDRLYCMFSVTPDMPGSLADFYLYKDECEDPVFTQLNLSIPELPAPEDEKLLCKEELGPGDCEAAGGIMSVRATTGAPYCDCP